MEQSAYILNRKNWYELGGPCNDVVISSRVRLARNLSNHSFPGTLLPDERKQVESEVIRAFDELPAGLKFTSVNFDALSETDTELISDRNVLGEGFVVNKESPILLSEDRSVVVVVNGDDHLKISAIKSGLSLSEAYDEVDSIDATIENSISFSVSNDYGYLTSRLENVGTGMKASILVHLPGLAMTSLIKDTFKILNEKGLANRVYGGTSFEQEGSIYEIFNYFTIGYSEKEIIENLTDLAHSLCTLERKMRGIIFEKKKKSIEDKVYRALGILKYSRSISKEEALKLLSLVRLGIALDLIRDYTFEQITLLLFSAYMNDGAPEEEMEIDGLSKRNAHDSQRAKIIREVLGR